MHYTPYSSAWDVLTIYNIFTLCSYLYNFSIYKHLIINFMIFFIYSSGPDEDAVIVAVIGSILTVTVMFVIVMGILMFCYFRKRFKEHEILRQGIIIICILLQISFRKMCMHGPNNTNSTFVTRREVTRSRLDLKAWVGFSLPYLNTEKVGYNGDGVVGLDLALHVTMLACNKRPEENKEEIVTSDGGGLLCS